MGTILVCALLPGLVRREKTRDAPLPHPALVRPPQTPPRDDALALLLAFGSASTGHRDGRSGALRAMPGTHAPVQRRRNAVRCNRWLGRTAMNLLGFLWLDEPTVLLVDKLL